MAENRATTLGELMKSGYKQISIKDEVRNNLLKNIKQFHTRL